MTSLNMLTAGIIDFSFSNFIISTIFSNIEKYFSINLMSMILVKVERSFGFLSIKLMEMLSVFLSIRDFMFSRMRSMASKFGMESEMNEMDSQPWIYNYFCTTKSYSDHSITEHLISSQDLITRLSG